MTSDTTLCRRSADLDSWAHCDWREGIQLEALRHLDALVIRTCNTTYEITVLCPKTGAVLVRGGRFFPVHTQARLAGSTLGGSFLKVRGVYVGFSLELHDGNRSIVTTRVQSVAAVNQYDVH